MNNFTPKQRQYYTPKLYNQSKDTHETITPQTIQSTRTDNKTNRRTSSSKTSKSRRSESSFSFERKSPIDSLKRKIKALNPYDYEIMLNEGKRQKQQRRSIPKQLPDAEDMYKEIQNYKQIIAENIIEKKNQDTVIRKLERENTKKDIEIERIHNYHGNVEESKNKTLIRRMKQAMRKLTEENLLLQDELEAAKKNQKIQIISELRERVSQLMVMLDRYNDICLQYSIDMTNGDIVDADQFFSQFFENFPDYQIPLDMIPSSTFDVRVVELENELLAKEEQIFEFRSSNGIELMEKELQYSKEKQLRYVNRIDELEEEISRLKKDQFLDEEEKKKSKRRYSNVIMNKKMLEKEIETLKKKNSELLMEEKKKNIQIQELHSLIEENAEKLDKLMIENNNLQKEKEKKLGMSERATECTEYDDSYKNNLKEKQCEIIELKEQIEKINADKIKQKILSDKNRSDNESLTQELATLKGHLDDKDKKIFDIQKELANSNNLLQIKSKDFIRLKEAVEKLKRNSVEHKTNPLSKKTPNDPSSNFGNLSPMTESTRYSLGVDIPKTDRPTTNPKHHGILPLGELIDFDENSGVNARKEITSDSDEILKTAKEDFNNSSNNKRQSLKKLWMKDKKSDDSSKNIQNQRAPLANSVDSANYISTMESKIVIKDEDDDEDDDDDDDDNKISLTDIKSHVLGKHITPFYDKLSDASSTDDENSIVSSDDEFYVTTKNFSNKSPSVQSSGMAQKSDQDDNNSENINKSSDDDFFHKTKMSMNDFEFMF
eukprot:TRINITY_DN3101_c1_g7_i1.p1 TRINITY_DN3101_c1_g7~~TRINITY_DN3101_c1_g7_i1.p1  ORF type:complete len:775 (+),score=245.06 TRINITY_DN3101_c1_g7_i1:171-2495(+)